MLDKAAIEARLKARLADLDEEDARAEGNSAPVELDQESVGRLSRMDALQVQAMASASQDRRRQERYRILAALQRLPTDEFGWCTSCGDAIAEARLMNDATVVNCIQCAL